MTHISSVGIKSLPGKATLAVSVLTFILTMFFPSAAEAQKILSVHKAKKQETVFGIARDYGVTIEELRNANPAMREEGFVLKKGMLINIPEHMAAAPAEKPAAASKQAGNITVGVMLPLHDINGDGRRMAEYYRGMLLAVSDLKRDGHNITVNAWNVAEDVNEHDILKDPKAKQCDVIFGPLYTKQVRGMADFCMNNNIRLVIPFSIDGNDVLTCPQIYQVYQAPADITAASIEQFMQRFISSHPVFVDCNDATSRKGDFTFGLRKRLEEKNISYSITNVNSSPELFRKAFVAGKRNVVILNTGRSPELGQVLKKLDEMTVGEPSLQLTMFGYNEWFLYTQVYGDKLRKYDTYIPSTYDYDSSSSRLQRIEREYNRNFKGKTQFALPNFALTGYDHIMFFVKGIEKYGKKFRGGASEKCYTYVQTPLVFERVGNGGYKNKAFMLVHFK